MIKFFFSLAFILCTLAGSAQTMNSIGISIGFSKAGFQKITDAPYNYISFGIPISIKVVDKVSIRATPTFLRYGEKRKVNKPVILYDVGGESYLNSIKVPLEFLFYFASSEEIYCSLNAGISYGRYFDGFHNLTYYTLDFSTNEVKSINSKGKVEIDETKFNKHELGAILGIDVGVKCKQNYMINLNFSFLKGLTNLNKNPQEETTKSTGFNLAMQLLKRF